MAISALELLEEGTGLYRQSFRDELWRYYLASAPFAAALLWYWERASSTAMPEVWGPALGLTLAYGVRILGTGSYSRRLLLACGGGAAPTSLGHKMTEIWAHAVLLILWWLGLICVIGTGVFYTAAQYVPFDGAQGLRPALRLAGRWWRQQWAMLGLAALFGAILLINLGLTALLLPGLLHSLLGVAGVVGRSGTAEFLTGSSLFWISLLLAVYLALDPLFKCAMVVSYHRLQAARSGADLATAIRKLDQKPTSARGRTVVAALALGFIFALAGSPAVRAQAAPVEAPVLRQAIQAELRQPPYAWHSAQASPMATGLHHFLARVLHPFDTVGNWLATAMQQAWEWIKRWIFGSPSISADGGAGGRGWERAAWILAAVCLLLIGGLMATRGRRQRRPPLPPLTLAAMPVDAATASAADQEAEAWFDLAQRLKNAGELRLAFRAAFLGGLAGLARRRLLTIRRDRTNREYYEEFARLAPLARSTASPSAFRNGIRAFDEVWYGGRGVDAERLDQFIAAQRELLIHA